MNKSTRIFFLAYAGLTLVGCAQPCKRCRTERDREVSRIERDRIDNGDIVVDDDPLRDQLEQALLLQNNPGLNQLNNPFNAAGLNQVQLPQQGLPGIFEQNNQGQALGAGITPGAQSLGESQQQAGPPAGQASAQSESTGPGPIRSNAGVAADAPVRRLQALVDASTHAAGEESGSRPPIQRRTAE